MMAYCRQKILQFSIGGYPQPFTLGNSLAPMKYHSESLPMSPANFASLSSSPHRLVDKHFHRGEGMKMVGIVSVASSSDSVRLIRVFERQRILLFRQWNAFGFEIYALWHLEIEILTVVRGCRWFIAIVANAFVIIFGARVFGQNGIIKLCRSETLVNLLETCLYFISLIRYAINSFAFMFLYVL